LRSEHEMKEWEKYDWNSLFKNMITYLRYELKESKICRDKKEK
jgi:hypothetical protein